MPDINNEKNRIYNITSNYDQMYEFENNNQLYRFEFKDTNVSMWMCVRFLVIEAVTYNKLYTANKQIYEGKRREKKIEKHFWQKYILKNPFLSRKKDIVFAFWEYVDMRRHEDGLVYEDFIMPFMKIFPMNTTTLMDGTVRSQYELDCAHPNWKMDDIFTDVLRYKKTDINNDDRKTIREFINYLEKQCPFPIWKDLKKDICVRLSAFARDLKQMVRVCGWYLQIVQPKVVIMFCASYPGILRTAMIIACKKRNVVTVELQHGWVGEYHSNYHYSELVVKNGKHNQTMPDYFLTFGRYWNDQVRMLSKCAVVGYAKPVIEDIVPDNNNILFCAGLHFEVYLEFLDIVMPLLDSDTKIYFRFHPSGSSQKQKNYFKKFLEYPNYVPADEKDLSDYMKECRYVIVDGSTVAYEALFMGRIVFALESELSIKLGFRELTDIHMFDNADSFIKLWDERNKLETVYHKEFFDLNYKINYIEFLKHCGVRINCK